jgi:hypothetical protein
MMMNKSRPLKGKKVYPAHLNSTISLVHPLVTATKQAQDLMKIVEALPDQETKDLAMELYKRLGEIE